MDCTCLMFFKLLLIFPVSFAVLEDTKRFLPADIVESLSIADTRFDSVVLVAHNISELKVSGNRGSNFKAAILQYLEYDVVSSGSCSCKPVLILMTKNIIPSSRVIFSPTGPVNRDFDDIRRYTDAASAGIKRALKAGSRAPLLLVQENTRYPQAQFLSTLAALDALYTPLEIRELKGESSMKADRLGIYAKYPGQTFGLIEFAAGLNAGRYLAKDICGTNPIRMTSPKVAEYVVDAFKMSNSVHVTVISDQQQIERQYPMLAAVNRASKYTPQFQARVIWLFYEGIRPIEETVMLVGKGITFDIGGLNIKTDGNMYSMSRDKCGAASVAGFFKVLDALKPRGLRVIGVMAMVRNNIGPEAYSCDEIITTRAGKRVRIVNTDAEGRMAMMDPLFEMKELAINATNPQIYTIATLTGHARLAVGKGYTIAMDNGPAKEANNAFLLQRAGDEIGDMIEISRIRREDYAAHTSKTEYEDLLQSSGTGSSSKTSRGHQNPAAFLIMGSGLDDHGTDSKHPLKYTHLDIAGAHALAFPDIPPGSPVTALAARHVLTRFDDNFFMASV